MRMLLVGLVAVIVGLLAGAVPLYMQLRDLEASSAAAEEQMQIELAQSQRRLAISSIHSKLAILASEVRAGEFENAQRTSTMLYDQVDGVLASLDDGDDKRRLLTIKETRDEVTAKLAVADPAILQALDRLFTLLGASL
jgi:hypothetical protein